MFSRFTRMTFLAVAASMLLSGPAMAKGPEDPSCAALKDSFRAAPEWYAERCGRGGGRSSISSPPTGFVPGDTAFYQTFFNSAIQTAPLPTLTFTNLGPSPLELYAIAFNNSATTLYGVDQGSRQLGTIDQTTGAFTPIAALNPDPGLFFVTGLAFDPAGPLVYVTLIDGAISNLYTIDTATAALTFVGSITGFGLVIDIKIDNSGQMYAHDLSDVLIRVDKATGAPTVVGPTGIEANFAQGMMYDASDDRLYGCVYDNAIGQMVNVEFDRGTGVAAVLAGPIPEEAECAIRVATGPCTVPLFSGLASATSAGTPACAINLAWNAATACPGTTVQYNVYRSTTPGVPPSPATLLRSCLTTLDYTDTTATGGTRYYYKVRAEDNTSGGTGACNNGLQDANLTERSAVPGGPITTTTDDVESGGGNWSTAGGTGTNPWTIVTTNSNSPTRSWFWPDPDVVTLQPLTRTSAFTFPADGGTWSWFHLYDTESTYDGYVAEYSLDGGTTWSDILLGQGTVPANPNRFTLNGYNATLSTGFQNPLPGRRAWSGAIAAFQEVRVDMADFAGRDVTIRWRAGSDDSVSDTGVWLDDISFGAVGSCTTVPAQAEALVVDSAGNRVYQPNETVVVAPTWRNTGANAITLTGALTNHTGPAGPVYTIPDSSADYGTIAVNGTASCASNCYSVANTTATRPATHWDSTALETVTPTAATKTWTLHVGDSFTDVPPSNPFYRFVETILHKGVSGGCSATAYCPNNSTTREQMAVFVLVSKEGTGYTPPACGAPMFTDVPASSPFCRWIEELARRGVVSGCGAGIYCPSAPATREQMAVFVLRTLDPALTPPACVAGSEAFGDVPSSSPFCRWIEELVRRGVVSGCGGGNYCPTANVSREQMSVFLGVTFSLALYGL